MGTCPFRREEEELDITALVVLVVEEVAGTTITTTTMNVRRVGVITIATGIGGSGIGITTRDRTGTRTGMTAGAEGGPVAAVVEAAAGLAEEMETRSGGDRPAMIDGARGIPAGIETGTGIETATTAEVIDDREIGRGPDRRMVKGRGRTESTNVTAMDVGTDRAKGGEAVQAPAVPVAAGVIRVGKMAIAVEAVVVVLGEMVTVVVVLLTVAKIMEEMAAGGIVGTAAAAAIELVGAVRMVLRKGVEAVARTVAMAHLWRLETIFRLCPLQHQERTRAVAVTMIHPRAGVDMIVIAVVNHRQRRKMTNRHRLGLDGKGRGTVIGIGIGIATITLADVEEAVLDLEREESVVELMTMKKIEIGMSEIEIMRAAIIGGVALRKVLEMERRKTWLCKEWSEID